MEVNQEALKALSLADIIALTTHVAEVEPDTHQEHEEKYSILLELGTELKSRLDNIFIF